MYNPALKYHTLNDEDFCIKTGIVVNGMLTIGGLLMFGKLEKILEFNHDFIIDYIEIPGASIKEAHTRYTYRMQEQENIGIISKLFHIACVHAWIILIHHWQMVLHPMMNRRCIVCAKRLLTSLLMLTTLAKSTPLSEYMIIALSYRTPAVSLLS